MGARSALLIGPGSPVSGPLVRNALHQPSGQFMALHAGEARPDGVHDRPQPTAGIGHASTVPACLTLYGGLEGWRAGGLEGWRAGGESRACPAWTKCGPGKLWESRKPEPLVLTRELTFPSLRNQVRAGPACQFAALKWQMPVSPRPGFPQPTSHLWIVIHTSYAQRGKLTLL